MNTWPLWVSKLSIASVSTDSDTILLRFSVLGSSIKRIRQFSPISSRSGNDSQNRYIVRVPYGNRPSVRLYDGRVASRPVIKGSRRRTVNDDRTVVIFNTDRR